MERLPARGHGGGAGRYLLRVWHGEVAAQGATGFTTIELKSNFFGSVRDGVIVCIARPLHQGRTTQVWDATVTPEGAAKAIAQFRNTQMILWPKG
jgi:1,4-dihydroxy-2-naphthoyl-CoA hydrolase